MSWGNELSSDFLPECLLPACDGHLALGYTRGYPWIVGSHAWSCLSEEAVMHVVWAASPGNLAQVDRHMAIWDV